MLKEIRLQSLSNPGGSVAVYTTKWTADDAEYQIGPSFERQAMMSIPPVG
jgi:hypothetical protein